MIAGALNFDELNALVAHKRAVPYEEYFGDMDLTEREVEERIGLAEELESKILPVMVLLFLMQLYGEMDWQQIEDELYDAYYSAMVGYMTIDQRMEEHMREVAQEIVQSTQEHMDDPYYFSEDRAQFISENETNTSLEYRDFSRATQAGKTLKTWRDMRDKRVRETHARVGGTTKPIWEPFQVGDYLMMFPKDDSLGAGAEELIGCRCHCSYT